MSAPDLSKGAPYIALALDRDALTRLAKDHQRGRFQLTSTRGVNHTAHLDRDPVALVGSLIDLARIGRLAVLEAGRDPDTPASRVVSAAVAEMSRQGLVLSRLPASLAKSHDLTPEES